MSTLHLLLVVSVWNVASVTTQDIFAFTAKKWVHISEDYPARKYVSIQDTLIFSCQTNEEDASTTLMFTKRPGGQYEDASNKFGTRMVRQGQTFSVNQIQLTDIGFYKCKAMNKDSKEIELELGQLYVDNTPEVYIPKVFPSESIYKIEANGRENITCKAHGAVGEKDSYLNWYKESDGKRVLVDNALIVRTEEIHDSEHLDVEIIVFKRFSEAFSGVYICVRKVEDNQVTEHRIEIELQPNASPKVTFDGDIGDLLSIKSGGMLTVACVVEGSPAPRKHWERNGQVVHDCPDYTNPRCVLVLRDVKFPENNGEYLCVGENIVKKTEKRLILVVQVPPLLEKLTNTIVASPNEDREILCELKSGNPLPTFVWKEQPNTCDPKSKECKPLEQDWKLVDTQYPSSGISTNRSYIISSKTIDYFYRCSVSSTAGNDSRIVTLVRNDKAPPQFQFTASVTNATEEDPLVLRCVVDYIYEAIAINKDGITISKSFNKTNNTITLTHSIPSLKVSDSAEYVCVARLRRGGEKKKSLLITVKELEKPVISNFRDITISQDDVEHFNISCVANGNPPPSVSWKFNNKSLEYRDISTMKKCHVMNPGIYYLSGVDNVLVFCSLNFALHGGEYECIAENKVGRDTKKMMLKINAMPKIVGWKNRTIKTFGVGLSEELECVTEANPPANVTWVHISQNSSRVVSHMERSILKFESVEKKDAGEYECIASNEFGVKKQTVYIQIVGDVVPVTMPEKKEGTIYGAVVAFVAVLIVVFILVFLYRRHLKKKYALYLEPNENFVFDNNRSLFEQSSELPYDLAWEFPRDRVNFVKTLGSGAFGCVWLAEADGIKDFKPRDSSNDARKRRKAIQKSKRYHVIKSRPTDNANSGKDMVAIKTLKDDAAEGEYKDLASELKILIHLGEHKNIVNLLGACTTRGNLFVILECCPHGNLLNFLREKREVFRPYWLKIDNNIDKEFTYVDLISIGYQVSQGMDFLQSKKCIHRDLAARNILVGENYVMKIADFGLARDIYKDEFYLKETTSLLPVKWMAPESLFDKVYTSSSDVWSFGILLWEIFTLGGSPYPGLPTEDLFSYLEDGKRMERPDLCPVDVYDIMFNCWEKSPYKRPLFAQIGETFGNVIRKNAPEDSQYLDLIPSNGHYLNPGNRKASKTSLNSAEFIEAVGTNGRVVSSPKGETYVPPPNLNLQKGTEEVDKITTPLLPPTDDEYVPMTPADHYQNPRAFTYGQEAMV